MSAYSMSFCDLRAHIFLVRTTSLTLLRGHMVPGLIFYFLRSREEVQILEGKHKDATTISILRVIGGGKEEKEA